MKPVMISMHSRGGKSVQTVIPESMEDRVTAKSRKIRIIDEGNLDLAIQY
ncbi:MAG TPA: hypothetical protein PLT09_09430 [Deltaproteobacteria bacterium]|nr:hypothetical protein [Deltaproteobacteria bacterium]HPR53558.1 hypothetical protein [Deltaproteobacteria bacterium]HXK47651.1 hypothetical protein [Deltaproteobacteria bacterium]